MVATFLGLEVLRTVRSLRRIDKRGGLKAVLDQADAIASSSKLESSCAARQRSGYVGKSATAESDPSRLWNGVPIKSGADCHIYGYCLVELG